MPPLEPSGALCAPGFLVSSCSSSLFEDLEYSEPSDLFQVHLAPKFLGEFSGALQCTARFQIRLSMDLLILKLPSHRAQSAHACRTGRPCGQCRARCDCFYGYHIFWSWLCFVDFFFYSACLFPSMDLQARTCVTSYSYSVVWKYSLKCVVWWW